MSDPAPLYQAETLGIIVRVSPVYLPDQSEPDLGRWVWAYHVEIENAGLVTVQLLRRRWIITDGLGREEIVEGPGVVGEQPVLAPGQMHAYTSGCPLPTPSGVMEGHYAMVTETGVAFEAQIPAFSLDLPREKRVLN